MDEEIVIAQLRGAGFQVQKSVRMGDDDGWRITLASGAVIYCFDDGRCVVHGPDAAALRLVLRASYGDKPLGTAAR